MAINLWSRKMKFKRILLWVGLSALFSVALITYTQKTNEEAQKEKLAEVAEQWNKMEKLGQQGLELKATESIPQANAWFDLSGKLISSSNDKVFSSIIKNDKLSIESPYEAWSYQKKGQFYYFKKMKNGHRPIGIVALSEKQVRLTKENKWFLALLIALFSILTGMILYQKQQQKERNQIPVNDILPVLRDFLAHPDKQKEIQNDAQEWQEVYRLLNELMRTTNHFYYEQVISEERLKTILENLDVGILIKAQNKEDMYNSVAEDLLFKQNELLNQVEKIEKELQTGQMELRKMIHLDFPYPKDLQVIAKGLRYESEELKEFLLIFYDVTPIKKTERLHEDFIRNITHELKTPTTSILGFSETLMEENLSEEEQKNFLRIIHKESMRLADLIQNVLLLSRNHDFFDSESSDQELIGEIIRKEIEQYEELAKNKQIRIDLDISSDASKVVFPKQYLQPIVKNLLENAIQYSLIDSEIRMKIWVEENQLSFSILDYGIGIPQSEQSRVFEKFYRVGNARDRKIGGTGLGLAIVQKFTEQLRGEIQLTSEENVGTYIVIKLPVERTI